MANIGAGLTKLRQISSTVWEVITRNMSIKEITKVKDISHLAFIVLWNFLSPYNEERQIGSRLLSRIGESNLVRNNEVTRFDITQEVENVENRIKTHQRNSIQFLPAVVRLSAINILDIDIGEELNEQGQPRQFVKIDIEIINEEGGRAYVQI